MKILGLFILLLFIQKPSQDSFLLKMDKRNALQSFFSKFIFVFISRLNRKFCHCETSKHSNLKH